MLIRNLFYKTVTIKGAYYLIIKGIRDKESQKGTMEQRKELSSTSHERIINNSTKTEQKKRKNIIPTTYPLNPYTNTNEPRPTFPSPNHLQHNDHDILGTN